MACAILDQQRTATKAAIPGLHGREVSLGVGEDLDQALESLLATGNAVRAQGHLLREQREQVAQAGAGLAAKCDVILVAGIDLPPLAVETAAPASTGIVDELRLGNAGRQICRRFGPIRDNHSRGSLRALRA